MRGAAMPTAAAPASWRSCRRPSVMTSRGWLRCCMDEVSHVCCDAGNTRELAAALGRDIVKAPEADGHRRCRRGSLALGAGDADDLGPFRGFGPEFRRALLGRARHFDVAEHGEAL